MRQILLASALTAALFAISAAPALAGPAETAFLQRLTANWTGRGHLSGAQSGPIACRVVISGRGQSAQYQGRCAIPDLATQAFNGSITYNDRTGHYEARTVGGVVQGQKRGNSLVFTDSQQTMAGKASSTMTMSPSSLVIDFSLVDQNGERTSSRITFGK
ncbi:MAG TPA: hypothetical protein VN109_07610 [Devosia sp.]|jgi:hypothetical protein|nr:hypothetical protein [Devosia sp.]